MFLEFRVRIPDSKTAKRMHIIFRGKFRDFGSILEDFKEGLNPETFEVFQISSNVARIFH